MDGNSFVDIFSTKGIEYILVLGFLAAFIGFWRLVRQPARAGQPQPAVAPEVGTERSWFELPEELLYHQGHGWVAIDSASDVVTIGLDDFAHKLLGEASAIRVPELGAHLKQGARDLEVTVADKAIEILSPISGEVVEVNQAALQDPGSVGDAPYSGGWLAKIKPEGLEANMGNLMSGRWARAWLDETVMSLRSQMAGSLGLVMQDGGKPVSGIARAMSKDGWESIARRHLRTL